ncbi:MAG: replication initiation protein [Betaproteobacteria bacterium]
MALAARHPVKPVVQIRRVIDGQTVVHINPNVPMEVRKAVEAIHIGSKQGRMTFLQRKIFNVLLLQAHLAAKRGTSIKIPLGTVSDAVGFNSNDIETMKAAMRRLTDIKVEFDIINDRGKPRWQISNLIAEASIEEGVLEFAFPPNLEELLMNPQIFSKIDLRIQRLFRSGYALALYENCLRFVEVGQTGTYDVQTWRELLGATEDVYQEFKYFKRAVLNTAIAEVNAVSNISLGLVMFKQGRRVERLQFKVDRQKQMALSLVASAGVVDAPLLQRVIELGFSENEAKDVLMKYEPEYVEGNLQVVEEKKKQRKISKSTKGYFLQALQMDFRTDKVLERLTTNHARQKKDALPSARDGLAALDQVRSEYAASRRELARGTFEDLEEGAKAAVIDEFKSSIVDNVILRDLYARRRLGSKPVAVAFQNFCVTRLLTEEPDGVMRFAAERGMLMVDTA